MKILIGVILLLLAYSLSAVDAPPEQQVRRLYVDLFNRLPSDKEVDKGLEQVKNYEAFVNEMLKGEEFNSTLARRIALHYSPNLSDKRNSSGELDPKYFQRFVRMKNAVQKNYLKHTDFRFFIKDLVEGRGVSSGRGALYFYDTDEEVEELTGRFADRVLGIPLKCAQCHDHREYNDLFQLDFWSLAAFFKNTDVVELKINKDVKELRSHISQRFNTRLIASVIGKKDYAFYNKWLASERLGIFIHNGDDLEVREKVTKRQVSARKLMAKQLLVMEKRVGLKYLKIQYSENRDDVVSAAVPGQTKSPPITIEPRKYLSSWVISDENPYLHKAVTNWVANWLYGRGFKMPLTDIYGKGLNDEQLTEYSDFLKRNKFNLKLLVKKMLMSDFYRARAVKDPELLQVEKFKQRSFRQIPAYVLLNKVKSRKRTSTKLEFDAEKDFVADILSNFPVQADNCESSFKGSVNQSVFISFDSNFTDFINRSSKDFKGNGADAVRKLIKEFFSRSATEEEVEFLSSLLKDKKEEDRSKAYADILWVLINSPEMRLY